MNTEEYTKEAIKLDRTDGYFGVADKLHQQPNARLFHAMIGLSSEVGELHDAFKRAMVYGRPLDKINLEEECGDILWYMAILLDQIGSSFEKVMQKNINKLQFRYASSSPDEGAKNRGLAEEREILEK